MQQSVQRSLDPFQVAVLPNKARLPTGIAAVRPHLEQVDNVPLLVGLITDCTPQANLQMLEIMQVGMEASYWRRFVALLTMR